MPATLTRWLVAACVLTLLTACAQGDTRRTRGPAVGLPRTTERPASASAAPCVAGKARGRGAALQGRGLDRAGYLAVADTLAARLCPLWDVRAGHYRAGSGTVTNVNADLLLVHSAAALAGHHGAARDDARAVALARFLTRPPVWGGGAKGWQAGPENVDRHVVFQAEVIEALQTAYEARAAIGLDAALVARIRRQVAQVARGRSWRWPALVLNQLNWYTTFATADAVVNGRERALATAVRRHLARFTRHARGVDGRAGNLAGGLRFQYLPESVPQDTMNFDSPEYANIVLSFSRAYPRARAAGMPKPADLPLLHEWVRRVLSGYWTHGGALNWDTGLGFDRWLQRKKTGLAQGALIGIAAARELQPSPRWGAWAKWLLDAGLTQYVALAEREGRIPAGLAYGVNVVPQDRGNAYLAASRQAANAMRALAAGLGERPGRRPPALYAFDPDTGRLAVTTPVYSTAIVPVNHGAFPYGGVDLARLIDAQQDVAGTLGGTGAAGFGLRVGTLRTQYGPRRFEPGARPLVLIRAPRGVGAAGTEPRAYAGPFRDLRVRGSAPAGTVDYRFTPRTIEARWTAASPGGVVTFPSWGREAWIERVRAGVYRVHSERAGYTLRLRGVLRTRILRPRPQRANPHPGPTLEVALADRRLSATITVTRR